MNGITIALSKGRIFDETLPLLAAAGIVPVENPETSRKLIIGTNRDDVRVVIVRASDEAGVEARLVEDCWTATNLLYTRQISEWQLRLGQARLGPPADP